MADSLLARRSARAKPIQSRSHVSSATSSTSGRSTRAFAKTGSPQKSTESASLSSEPPDDGNDEAAASLRRRSMRGKDELERDPKAKIELLDMAPPSGDEIGEDDEAVRCVCGHDEYPGPPPYDAESKYGLKDAIEFERIFGIEITDEIAGNFVQCEVCNSWQHSACVGFTNEDSGPDDVEYFCEQCRKDLHKVYTAGNGQKYSIFLPIHRTSRAVSRATSAAKETARSRSPKPIPIPNANGKMSRAAAAAAAAAVTSKRRSTMNSRDAAYDEEEQLRRAIEASKEQLGPEEAQALLAARRAPKRGREESEEKQENLKRQRTDSRSPSPSGDKPIAPSLEESEDESLSRNGISKKSRNAVRNQRERVERDERREEQERKRAEAASKRKGRAERRRADDSDSDPSEEMPLAARAGTARASESAQPPDPPPSSVPPPDTPPAIQAPASSHKKKAASHHKKGKGRNQYTKDRDHHDHDESPARSMSREVGRNAEESLSSHGKGSGHDGPARASHKAKGGMNSRVTLTDLKRRASGILDYIGRTQVELASEPLSESKSNSSRSTTGDPSIAPAPVIKTNGETSTKEMQADSSLTNGGSQSKEFKEMSCVEMMDILTRDLVKWQQEFAS